MARRKIIAASAFLCVVAVTATGIYLYERVSTFKMTVNEIFELNDQRKQEGYYTAEFEFKMLGVMYLFDHGSYLDSIRYFDEIHSELKTGDRLIKVPEFADKNEELAFYLDLQDPATGAFMDPSYPLATYFGPTLNVIQHLESLADSIAQPLQLEYPLSFLEQLDSPDELRAYLDDVATVGLLASKLPETPYILANLDSYRDLERLGLFTFSPEWKEELAKWMWETQDPETGYWGVRLRSSGELVGGGDINVTRKHIKELLDENGLNRYENYPLRHIDRIVDTTLDKLRFGVPDSMSEQHDWSIDQFQYQRLLIDYLWGHLSADQKSIARERIAEIVHEIYSRFYVRSAGAFNLYADQDDADLDGTNTHLGSLRILGVFSAQRQRELWGSPEETIHESRSVSVARLAAEDLSPFAGAPDVNSIRFYADIPAGEGYLSDAVAFVYPKDPVVLDALELAANLNRWIFSTSQGMGNWVSKETLMESIAAHDAVGLRLNDGETPLSVVETVFEEQGRLVAVGFDTLQIPCRMVVYTLEGAGG